MGTFWLVTLIVRIRPQFKTVTCGALSRRNVYRAWRHSFLGCPRCLCYFAFTRMPGRSPGVPINSMPATSSVRRIILRFAAVLFGTPSVASMRMIVRSLTPVSFDSRVIFHPSAALAALICALVIIDNPSCVIKYDKCHY